MSDPIADYVATLRRELTGVPHCDDLVSEMEDHLRETADALAATGCPAHLAGREAVQRFGRPGLVARSIRTTHLHPSDRDPAPARRWVFTLTECLLILASLAAVGAIYLHWLPCGGDAITPDRITDACLSRMDGAWAFPFAPRRPASAASSRTPSGSQPCCCWRLAGRPSPSASPGSRWCA